MHSKNYFLSADQICRYINKHGTAMVHAPARYCSCSAQPSCNYCGGKGIYFDKDDYQIIRAALFKGRVGYENNRGIGEKFRSYYDLLLPPKYLNVDKWDGFVMKQGRWYVHRENVRIGIKLRLDPIEFTSPITFTDQQYGKLIQYYHKQDFIRESSNRIKFLTPPPEWAIDFSVSYWGRPSFQATNKPTVGIGRGEAMYGVVPVKLVTSIMKGG